MRAPSKLALAAGALAWACNFDAAFDRYCSGNPLCRQDAGAPISSDAGSPRRPWPVPSSCPCGPDEVCHPFGNVCLRVCTSPADCPSGLENCATLTDPSGQPLSQKACTCGASSCGEGALCSQFDDLCEERCTTYDDCGSFRPPRRCKGDLCMPPPR